MPLFKAFSAPEAAVTLRIAKPGYFLGDSITGTISVLSKETFDCQEVRAELVGTEMVKGRLSDFSGSIETRIYSPVNSGNVQPGQQQTVLQMASKPAKVAGPLRITAGQRKDFAFSVSVPANMGPTYQGAREDGSWMQRSWLVKAVLAVAGRPDLESKAEVSVQALPPPPTTKNTAAAIGTGTAGAAAAAASGASSATTATAATAEGAQAQVPAPAATQAARELPTQCPKCSAPMKITQEDTFYTCRYCGQSTLLGTPEQIKRHSMMINKIYPQQAVEAAKHYMDKGILRVGVAKDAKITSVKLRYMPFWVFPADATTSFRGSTTTGGATVATGNMGNNAATAATIGQLILVGADMYMRSQGRGGIGGRNVGRRPMGRGPMSGGGGFGWTGGMGMPGQAQSQTRTIAQTFSSHYSWPLLARETLISDVKFYDVPLDQKIPFDPGKIPPDAEFLNSEYTEEDAITRAKSEIEAKERQTASSKVQVLETISTNVTLGEGELIHAPVWHIYYTLKGENFAIAIDGSVGKVLGGGRPTIKLM